MHMHSPPMFHAHPPYTHPRPMPTCNPPVCMHMLCKCRAHPMPTHVLCSDHDTPCTRHAHTCTSTPGHTPSPHLGLPLRPNPAVGRAALFPRARPAGGSATGSCTGPRPWGVRDTLAPGLCPWDARVGPPSLCCCGGCWVLLLHSSSFLGVLWVRVRPPGAA